MSQYRTWNQLATPSPQSSIEVAEPSFQSLILDATYEGASLGTATGFVVETLRGPALITNRHVVTGRDNETGVPLSKTGGIPNSLTILQNSSVLGQWVPTTERLYDGDEPKWIEHPTLKSKADIVALLLTDLARTKLYPYKPRDAGLGIKCGPSDMVSVVGFPFGLTAGAAFAIWATGFIASEPGINLDGLPKFLIDCRSRKGQSGSPVIAYRSGGPVSISHGATTHYSGPVFDFLGVYSGRINEQSDLGIVWKRSALVELIDSIK